MTHLKTYHQNINNLLKEERWKGRLRRQAIAISKLIKMSEAEAIYRPKTILDGEIMITVKK